MPKAGNSRKRKKEGSKNEKPKGKSKKTKLEDGGDLEEQSKSADVPCKGEKDVTDIDEILEKNAAKNNLTAINVKSIIHHVVTDKRVLALVQSAMAEADSEESRVSLESVTDNVADVELDFAPLMTRAKSKQTAQGDPIAVLASQSPIKELRTKHTESSERKCKKINFTELELPESSSDEEYNPDEEEERSDEDTESCVSFTSDLASPQVPGTPEHHKPDVPNDPDDKTDQQEFAHTVTRSLSKKLCQEPFKVPYPVASTSLTQAPVEEISAGEGDLIAKRTRSQLPLLDTPIEIIEATFQAPDFTADMYDTIQEEDLDFDDIEWQKWLQGLINTDETFGEEDHEDTEYNFMAEDQKEEKEEYRNDRAVRIPQKEVNELMEELLKDYDGGLVDEIFFPDEDTSDMVYVEVISESPVVKEDVKLFNSRQLEQLSEQLQQHTQLLTQICVLAQEEPSLSHVAEISRDYVNELKGFHDRASNAELIRGLGDGVVHASAFTYQGLDQAVQIVNSKFDSKRRTPNPRKSVSPRKDKSPPKRIKRTKNPHEELLPPLSQTSIQLMATSTNVFRFTELLPHCNLLPKTGDTPKLLKGLRVKFSEAEDNLLALGLQEFDKQWDLIQQHLLPVKSAKQLQIRCKNLLSNRASENIIKFYRRNKQLWELPTITESVGRRLRGRDLVEPEWLMNYKKKQKETREVEEKRETLVTQQNAEGAAFGRPIAPKLGRACAVALQSGTAVGEQVAWVTITSPGRSWTAVTTPPPICEEKDASRDHKTTTITQITTTTQPCPVSSVCEESTSISPTKETEPPLIELPAEDMAVESGENSVTLQTEVELAGQSQESSTRETNLAPACKDPVPSTTSETDKENHTEDTADKPAPDTAANKPTSTAKTKPLRDKPVVGVSGGRVTSRSHCTVTDGSGTASVTSRKPAPNSQTSSVGNYVLEPDPKFRVRAHAFAENFLAKVKKELKDDPGTYEEFLQTLSMSSSEQCSPVELYRRVEVVLAQYPDLVEDFVGFLEPHQAVEAGVFMENLEFVRARTFLRRLEVHFQKSPSHFRKIMNAFDSWNKSASKDPLELQQAIVPMLKGQQHLIEELFSFFDDMKPPTCSDDDFEEVEFGSGSEPEVDDFEDVVIPCFVEPKKIKGRPAKGAQKPGGKNLPAGKPNTARKPATNVKGTKQQGTASKPAVNKTKKSSNTGKDLTSESRKNTEEQCKDLDNKAKRTRCRTHPDTSTIVENAGGDDGHDIHKTELSASDGPLSVAASLQSETSNDSCRGEEFIPITTDTLNLELEEQDHRSSDSEEQEDDVNTDVENSPRDDGYEEDDDDYDDVDAAEYPEDFAGCDVDSDVTGGDVNIDVIASDADADVTGCDSDANMLSSEGVVPAKNLHRSEDGQLVLVWTREDDREILQACQKMGAKKETFRHVAITLQDKTVDEVEKRFVDLMNLFKASSGERTRESTNEETGSEDEDEEDSETIGESEGE